MGGNTTMQNKNKKTFSKIWLSGRGWRWPGQNKLTCTCESCSALTVSFPCWSGLLRNTVMWRVSRRSPSSKSSSAASRTILFTRPLLGPCGAAGVPLPPPAAADTPISGSAADEEPQHHCGATSGSRRAIFTGKRVKVLRWSLKGQMTPHLEGFYRLFAF